MLANQWKAAQTDNLAHNKMRSSSCLVFDKARGGEVCKQGATCQVGEAKAAAHDQSAPLRCLLHSKMQPTNPKTAAKPVGHFGALEDDGGGWSQVPSKSAAKGGGKKTDSAVGRHSRFQLYVTGAFGLNVSEMTRAFERFGTLNEAIDMNANFPGVAFVKFRTRAAAAAAVAHSPILCAGVRMHAEFLDLTRQTKHAEYNREQERTLMVNEPVVDVPRVLPGPSRRKPDAACAPVKVELKPYAGWNAELKPYTGWKTSPIAHFSSPGLELDKVIAALKLDAEDYAHLTAEDTRWCDDEIVAAFSPAAKHDDWDAASLASSAETVSLTDAVEIPADLARTRDASPSLSYAAVLRSSTIHDGAPSYAEILHPPCWGACDGDSDMQSDAGDDVPPSPDAPTAARCFYSDVLHSWQSAPQWDRVKLLPRTHLPGLGCTSTAMDASAYLEAACTSTAALEPATGAHVGAPSEAAEKPSPIAQNNAPKPRCKLPKSVTDVLETSELRGTLCTFCASLQNIELGPDGSLVRAFCRSCCTKLGQLELNRCKGGSSQCQKYRWVDGLGNVAAVCSACYRSGSPAS